MAPGALPAGDIAIDASFLIAVLDGDALATRFAGVLGRSVVVATGLAETCYRLDQRAGIAAATTVAMVGTLGVQIDMFDEQHAETVSMLKTVSAASKAAQVSAGVTHPKTLSFGDLCVLAHATVASLPVLTGDKHWLTLGVHGLTVDVYDFRDPNLTT